MGRERWSTDSVNVRNFHGFSLYTYAWIGVSILMSAVGWRG